MHWTHAMERAQDEARADEARAAHDQQRARVGALVQEESVADSLVDSSMHWCDLRALAVTCKLYGSKVAKYFAQPKLALHAQDCTDDNFRFLVEQLLMKGNPNLLLDFCDTHITQTVGMRDWMYWNACTLHLADWITKGRSSGEEHAHHVRLILTGDMCPTVEARIGHTEAWFLGRAWAMLDRSTSKIRVEFPRPHAPDIGGNVHASFVLSMRDVPEPGFRVNEWFRTRMTSAQRVFFAGCYLARARDMVDKLIPVRYTWTGNNLEMSKHYLDDAGADALVAQMRAVDIKLKSLKLHHCVSDNFKGFLTPLLAGRMDTTRLSELTITKIPEDTRHEYITALATAQRFPHLKRLNLTDVGLTNQNMATLAPSFGEHGSLFHLQSLWMGRNDISGVGLELFAAHALHMPNLETLSMPRLPINGQDILRFARAVKNEATWTHMKFVTLHGPDPTATDREVKFLQSAVKIVRILYGCH
tara:strand:+ start:2310 stop:3731 length:1422 start_codon:yes stop_codon:yes gene_type:complete